MVDRPLEFCVMQCSHVLYLTNASTYPADGLNEQRGPAGGKSHRHALHLLERSRGERAWPIAVSHQ